MTLPTIDALEGFIHQGSTITFPAGLTGNVTYAVMGRPAGTTYIAGRTAGTAIHLVQDGVTATYVRQDWPTSQSRVFSGYFRVPSAPSVDNSSILVLWTGAGVAMASFTVRTSGNGSVIRAQAGAGTRQTGPNVCDNAWHLLEFYLNSSGATWTVKWRVDGVDQTDATEGSHVATDSTQLGWGSASSGHTATVDWDDCVGSVTSTDYTNSLLATSDRTYYVAECTVNGDGTHHTGTNNIVTQVGGTTSLYTVVDDWATVATDTADYLTYTSTTLSDAASNYAELSIADKVTGSIGGVRVDAAMFASGTGSNDFEMRLLDSSNNLLSTVFDGDVSETGLIFARTNAVTAPGGGWDTDFNGLKLRVGFSGDTNANPRLAAVGLQYAVYTDNVTVVMTASAAATAAVGTTSLTAALPAVAATATADVGTTSLLATIIALPGVATAAGVAPAIASKVLDPVILAHSTSTTNATSYSLNTLSRAVNTNEFLVMGLAWSRTSPDTPTPPTTVVVGGITMTLHDSLIYKPAGGDILAVGVWYGQGQSPAGQTISLSGFGYTVGSINCVVAGWPGVKALGLTDKSTSGNVLSPGEEDTLTLVGSAESATSRTAILAAINSSGATIASFPTSGWEEFADAVITAPSQELALGFAPDAYLATGTFRNDHATSNLTAGGIMFELEEEEPTLIVTILAAASAAADADAASLSTTLIAAAAAAVADAPATVPGQVVNAVVATATADGIATALEVMITSVAAEAVGSAAPVLFPIVYTPVGRLGLGDDTLGSSVMGNVVLGEPGMSAPLPIEMAGIIASADADAGVPVINLTVPAVAAAAAAAAGESGLSPELRAAIADAAAAIADSGLPTPYVLIESAVAVASADGLAVVVLGIDQVLRISFADVRFPDQPPALRTYWSELEAPDGPNRSVLYYADMETIPNVIKIYQAEYEAPEFTPGDRSLVIGWADLSVPQPVRRRRRDDTGTVDRWHRQDVHHW